MAGTAGQPEAAETLSVATTGRNHEESVEEATGAGKDKVGQNAPTLKEETTGMDPALKKTKLQFISQLSSEELETHALGDELNVTLSRAYTEHQQPSEELYTKRSAGLQVALSPPKENQLANPPSHASNPDKLPNLPSKEPLHDEVIQSQWSSSRIQADHQGSIVSQEPGSDQLPGVQNQEPPCLEALCESHPDQSPSVLHQELPAPDIQLLN
ncbi:hypothetical protein BKA83DRAFT_4491732 [Pisolithus microcarpus]|nr:hypothetical protein BKA83DRAFT_4491732 [Pisolithus microcarpus]